MRQYIRITIIILSILVVTVSSDSAQFKKDSTCIGALTGIVRDSSHNYVMQSATLAVYRVKDSALVSYQLSNNFGEFNFKQLPVGTPLRIVASYIGYKNTVQKFIITAKTSKLDLKHLNMDREAEGENTGLEDVVVKSVPPVQMNGDTLEFNADAFHLDPNAVAEDLLRKLPGVVVWGDGTITVHGREVSRVLVNGKPFFGGDTKVATQNLPKKAVEKVQVYQQSKNKDNPLDSITEVNIQLKKGKEVGRFGKLAGGVGTDKHYEVDGNINFFTNRTQLGIVGGINDINKVAGDVNTLMRNSTYKGVGASIEYQPDFSMSGINLSRAGGFTFQQDFIEHPDYYQNNRLTSNYFIRSGIGKQKNETKRITSLGGDSTQTQQSISQQKSTFTPQNFTAKYEKKKDNYAFDINLGLNTAVTDNTSQSNTVLTTSYGASGSTNSSKDNTHNENQGANLSAHVQHDNDQFLKGILAPKWSLDYGLTLDNNDNLNLKQTRFTSLTDPTQNQYIDRKYNTQSNGISQYLSLDYGGLSKSILPRRLRSIDIRLKNTIGVSAKHQNNWIGDKDTLTGKYTTNTYLSGKNNYTQINERPGLEFSKTLYKSLANRYSKSITFTALAQQQFYYKKNESSHDFQNITQKYQQFIPSAGINIQNYQYGAFMDVYNLRYETGAAYADISQLAPLVDSSNLYYIHKGNLHLTPSYTQSLNFRFNHNSFTAKNPFNYNFGIGVGKVDHNFADSSVTDSLGRSTHYTINIDGYKYLSGNLTLNKAFKFKNHQIQISYYGNINISRNPSYINAVFNYSKSFSENHSLTLNYNMKDNLAVNLMQSYGMYRSAQQGANNLVFKNTTAKTRLSTSIKCTRRLTVGSNITYNHTTSSGSDATNFTIWNAQAYYRFFKGNNLELKFSALDLLHQNTSIINYGSNNVISRGTAQVLQNYYMVTLSFYPRRFGKKK
ncbi:carboxypeptidase-like regulatory domain-containing protein [Arachidicoccus ginsenosidivorans]